MSAEQPTSGLTPQEDQLLLQLLLKWTGGNISTPVFTQLARMIPMPIVEVVIFKDSGNTLKTLLIPRPENDIKWKNMVHTPGTALRASDYYREDNNPLKGAFERIQQEIKNTFVSPPTFAGRLHRLGERGPDVTEVYIAHILDEINLRPNQIWFPVKDLAQNPNFIQSQLAHVLIAADFYRKSRIKHE